jgi:type IV pilus assembly protein PilZ
MNAADESAQKRTSPRAPIELKVEYKKMNTFFSDYTKNISKGGTFIKTERPLKIGTEFVFKLFVPARESPFEIRGQVAWINTENDKQRPDVEDSGMGIRFLYDDDSQRRDFEGVVEDLMKDALGEVVYENLMKRTR